jgi:hypothetical protein
MKRIISLLMASILCVMLVGCGSKDDGKINMPGPSNDMEGANYKEVVKELQDAGFTNVQTKVLDDIVLGWLTKDGEVEQVSVDSYTIFSTDSRYAPNTEIIVTYHTFPEDTSKEVAKNETSDEKSQEPENAIITVDNNKEFAVLLQLKDEFDPSIKEFATKYAGITIEYDGNIANMMQNGNYKTRYDILIYAGDYSETNAIGPSFKFKDVNVSDLNITGSEIPENIGAGQNIHIIAKVEEYNEVSGFFFLKPVSTKFRK